MAAEAGRLPALDGWRGLAIVALLCGHFAPVPGVNLGRFGVELFFVLSGSLMAKLLFDRKDPLGTFYWRRVSRIVPTALLFLAAVEAIQFARGGWPAPVEIATAATFTYNYAAVFGMTRTLPVDHYWSLCVEEHSYLVLSVVALLSGRSRAKAAPILLVLVALCVGNAIRLGLAHDWNYHRVYWRSDTRMSSVLLGFAAGLWGGELARVVGGRWPAGWTYLFLAAGAVLQIDAVPDPVKYTVGTACLAVGVGLLGAAARTPVVFRLPGLRTAGLASFSIYLWQQLFYKNQDVIPVPLGLALAVAVGLVSYWGFENPVRRYLNRRVGRRAVGGPEPCAVPAVCGNRVGIDSVQALRLGAESVSGSPPESAYTRGG